MGNQKASTPPPAFGRKPAPPPPLAIEPLTSPRWSCVCGWHNSPPLKVCGNCQRPADKPTDGVVDPDGGPQFWQTLRERSKARRQSNIPVDVGCRVVAALEFLYHEADETFQVETRPGFVRFCFVRDSYFLEISGEHGDAEAGRMDVVRWMNEVDKDRRATT